MKQFLNYKTLANPPSKRDKQILISKTPKMDSVKSSLKSFNDWIRVAKLDAKDYQEEGVSRMLELDMDPAPKFGCRGGFLTDEMGLGKTIQMLGLIISNPQQRTLIVVPRALIDQWEVAIIKFLGHRPLVFHGSRKLEKDLETSPVVISTYGTAGLRFTKAGKELVSPLAGLKWGRVIYDEAHHMRNAGTGAFKGAQKLKSKIQWFVTGTPIQNAQSDVFSLLKLLGIPRDVYGSAAGLREIAEHFRIGRTKADVGIDLKPVVMHDVVVPWSTDAELNIAADLHSTLSFSEVTSANVDALIAALSHHPLPALLRCRQACIHTRMLKEAAGKLVSAGILKEDDVRDGIQGTSKLSAVLETLTQRREMGNKLVFCYFHSEIDYLAEQATKLGFKVAVIDGRTSQSEREARLSDPYDILILQTQASCEGLNLQSYSEVYFTSPHWNPAVQDQAIARAHRIGQEKEVHVFQYHMEGFGDGSRSIDDYCLAIQKCKRELMKKF